MAKIQLRWHKQNKLWWKKPREGKNLTEKTQPWWQKLTYNRKKTTTKVTKTPLERNKDN